MPQTQAYHDYSSNDCMIKIMHDIVNNGKSSGWYGSKEEVQDLGKKLESFNIFYVDDFHGTWKQKKV